MKFLRIALFIGLFYLLPSNLVAQWYKLPALTNPWVASQADPYPPCPLGESLPSFKIYPAGNGEIIYDADCGISPSSGSDYEIIESNNDLGTTIDKFYADDNEWHGALAMVSYNDSIHAFILTSNSVAILYYTTNNFSTVKMMEAPLTSSITPLAITKKFIYFTFQLSFVRDTISSNWYNQIPFPRYSGHGKLLFVNDSTGFMLTYHISNLTINRLIKTSNYAATWNDIFFDTLSNITDYCFPSKDTGYLITSSDSLFKTTNGGTTWNKLAVPFDTSFTCIQFANGQIGYIGGKKGFLIRTIDGGLTWKVDSTGDGNTVSSLYTFGTSLVYFVDNSFSVYKNQPLLLPPPKDSTKNSDTTVIYKTSLFPNPNNGNFTVTLQSVQQPVSLEVFTLLGRKMFTTPLSEGDNNISFQYEQKGLYFYKIIESNGNVLSWGKFVYVGNN